MLQKEKTVIIICGPTAVGKTSLAIQLAKHYDTEIISADSRQCFRELSIGVAKPTPEELGAVPHHFINSHSIHDNVNAAVFETYALQAADKIFTNKDVVIMVGGTGLYIKALTDGLDEVPAVDPGIRLEIIKNYETSGITYLQETLKQNDPQFWEIAEQQNPQRLMRALEVMLSTGKSISEFHKGQKQIRPFNIMKIGLELPREILYQQINQRVDQMMEAGLLKEVESLLPHRDFNALQTVGYQEFFPFFDGTSTLPLAVDEVKKHTRHYAKRQLTWFKRDAEITWHHAHQPGLVSRITALT